MISLAFALALAPTVTAGPNQPYSSLWTQWPAANSAALHAEAARQVPAAPSGPLRAGSPELGARVGEIVRAGDCEEGERVARAAGDFPLVEAVRAHCRPAIPAMSHVRPQAIRSR